jgi:hypothetical protein
LGLSTEGGGGRLMMVRKTKMIGKRMMREKEWKRGERGERGERKRMNGTEEGGERERGRVEERREGREEEWERGERREERG